MKADNAAEHFDGGLEQDDGGGAVHVVVAVEQHRLTAAMARSSRSTAAVMPSMRKGSWRCAGSGFRKAKACSGLVMPRATSSSAST
jgi:hypothetical protein